jgi:hypothetical protein
VHFMAETAKILAPEKTVLIPDAAAGCSLAGPYAWESGHFSCRRSLWSLWALLRKLPHLSCVQTPI